MQSFILSERDKLNMFHCVKNLLQGLPLDVKTIGRTFLDDSQSQVCFEFDRNLHERLFFATGCPQQIRYDAEMQCDVLGCMVDFLLGETMAQVSPESQEGYALCALLDKRNGKLVADEETMKNLTKLSLQCPFRQTFTVIDAPLSWSCTVTEQLLVTNKVTNPAHD